MARSLLALSDIKALDQALIQTFAAHSDLRRQYPVASYIQFPPIPSILTVSIANAAAALLLGADRVSRCELAGSHLLCTNEHGAVSRVVVKATASSGFQEIKANDLNADFFVWLDVGDRYQRGEGPLHFWILRHPRSVFPEPRRIVLSEFLRLAQPSGLLSGRRFDSLDDLLL